MCLKNGKKASVTGDEFHFERVPLSPAWQLTVVKQEGRKRASQEAKVTAKVREVTLVCTTETLVEVGDFEYILEIWLTDLLMNWMSDRLAREELRMVPKIST